MLAAVERLHDLPIEQVSITAIAQRAGVSRSVFYTHFSGLEELLAAVLTETADSAGPLEPTDNASPRQLARDFLERLVDHIDSRATFYTAALAWRTTVGVHDAAVADYARRLRTLIEMVRRNGPRRAAIPSVEETDFTATFIAGGISAALTVWLQDGRVTPKTLLIDRLLELLPGWLLSDETVAAEPHNR